jgi:transitional endoplasmic reticulum ATPase
MRVPLEITFGKSPAAHYGQAVQRAQAFTGYQQTGEGKAIVHTVRATLSLAHEATWNKLHKLLQMVYGWRSTHVTVAGQAVRYGELASRLTQVRACYARKVRHGAGPGYCSGKRMPGDEAAYFGCRFCQGISRQVDDPDSWIQFGALSAQQDVFRVNKAAIFKTLEQQTRADGCLFCPAFRWQHVRADVDDLPEVIALGKDSLFEVKTSAFNPKKALGIQLKKAPEEEDWIFPLDREARAAESAPMRNVPTVRYADIAGQDAALEQLKHVVELPLTHRAYFEALRVEPQSGVLLYGPPGNGKTLLAKAVATESNAHFELISGPEVLSKWVGESEANLRKLFARARQLAPSVVLIDELDSLAPRRDRVSQHHDVQVLSQLLVLLDGLEARGSLAIVATTNRLDAIDPALRRPGRFDYHIEVPVPEFQGRLAILQVCLAKMKTRGNLRMEALAEATAGYSGAELAALCREAGLQAIRRGLGRGLAAHHLFVSRQDLQQALTALRVKRFSPSPQPENASLLLPGIGSTSPIPRGN